MVRPEEAAEKAIAAGPAQPARPSGIGLSALALAALLGIGLLRQLWQLWQGPAGGLGQFPGARLGFALVLICGHAVGWIGLWQFWKGQNWARIAVLLWAFVTAVRMVAFLADHNLDPAALMARPLRFFPSLLAVVLLYWLNTPALRNWFGKLSAGPAALVAERLVGKLCTGVEFGADVPGSAAWRIGFEHDAELLLHCPWRIVLDNNLAFATPPVGATPVVGAVATGNAALPAAGAGAAGAPDLAPNPAPDSPGEARRLLKNLRVTALRVAEGSSDLVLTFEMGIELQSWLASPPTPSPQWCYRDHGIVVIADETGVKPQRTVAPAASAADRAGG